MTGVPPPFLLLAVAWLTTAYVQFRRVFTFRQESLSLGGFIGGPICIEAGDAVTARYVGLRVKDRLNIEVRFVEIRSGSGTVLHIPLTGWGRARRNVLATLTQWLARTGASMDENTGRVLREQT